MNKPTLLLCGAGGQLGRTFIDECQSSVLAARVDLIPLTRSELDISDREQLIAVLDQHAPQIIINAAAYTAVDKAEQEREAAFAINERGAANLAHWVAQRCALIHISTDFVFDGNASSPYGEEAVTHPLGVYGASKLAGEQALLKNSEQDISVIRTSWLYSEHGANFVKTMLRLMAERDELRIVDDQFGLPTSAHSLSRVLLKAVAQTMAGQALRGVLQWSDGGEAISWFDFATEIQTQALARGLLTRSAILRPIPASDYPTPARRPAYSVMSRRRVLEQLGCAETVWQDELGRVLDRLVQQNVR